MNSTKKQLFSGVFYTALSKYSGIVVSLVVASVLARLLSPDDFGIVAVASVIISFFNLFTDIGLSAAIIQHKDLTKKELSDLFSVTLIGGVILAIGFALLSTPIANYYQRPILDIICKLLSVNLFLSSASIVPNALFYKNKEFKYIAVRGFVIQIVGGVFAVIVAFMGGGLYALLINPMLSSLLLFIVSIKKYPLQFNLRFEIKTVQKIFSYSLYQFLFSVINYFSRNADKLLIGKYMSMVSLGYYEKSYRLMMLPLQNVTQVITPVMHPILSEFQNDMKHLALLHEKIVRILAVIGFPLSVFLFFTAKEITLLLFGDQWMSSVSVFQILSLSVGTQIVFSSSGSIFQAAGDTKSLFICGLFSSILNVGGILLGVFYFKTLDAVAICLCTTITINFIQCYLYMYIVTLKQNIYAFVKIFISPLLLSLLLGGVFFLLSNILFDISLLMSFIIKTLVFSLIWGAYIQLSGVYDVIGKVKSIIKKRT